MPELKIHTRPPADEPPPDELPDVDHAATPGPDLPAANPGEPPILAMTFDQTWRSLGLGRRTLWSLVAGGKIPHARIGRRVLFPIDQLKEWLAQQAKKGMRR